MERDPLPLPPLSSTGSLSGIDKPGSPDEGPDYLAFSVVIDDVVLPDGRTLMGVLGGGGVQSAFGMRLWSPSVGQTGSLGVDFPPALWQQMADMGLDLRALRRGDQPSLRAWQIFEADGRRRQLWRSGSKALAQNLPRRFADLSESARRAKAAHLGLHPLQAHPEFLDDLHACGVRLSAETFRPAERPLTDDELRVICAPLEVISLNGEEATSVLGAGTREAHLEALIAAGARVAALRLGSEGSIVSDGHDVLQLPAPPVRVRSLLGAGNAWCGGFLTGWVETGDLREAGARGAVAASFLLEQVGVPALTPQVLAEAQRRRKAYLI